MATRRLRVAVVAGVSAACATGGIWALGPAASAAPVTRDAWVAFDCAWQASSGGAYGPAFTARPELALAVATSAKSGDAADLTASAKNGRFAVVPAGSTPHELVYTGATLTASSAAGRTPGPDVTLRTSGDGRTVGADGVVTTGAFTLSYELTGTGSHAFVVKDVTLTFTDKAHAGAPLTLKCDATSNAGGWPVVAVNAATTPTFPTGPRTLQQGVVVSGNSTVTPPTSPTATGTGTASPTSRTSAPTTPAPTGTTPAGSSGGGLAATGSGDGKTLAFAMLAASLLLGGLAVLIALPHRRRSRRL